MSFWLANTVLWKSQQVWSTVLKNKQKKAEIRDGIRIIYGLWIPALTVHLCRMLHLRMCLHTALTEPTLHGMLLCSEMTQPGYWTLYTKGSHSNRGSPLKMQFCWWQLSQLNPVLHNLEQQSKQWAMNYSHSVHILFSPLFQYLNWKALSLVLIQDK